MMGEHVGKDEVGRGRGRRLGLGARRFRRSSAWGGVRIVERRLSPRDHLGRFWVDSLVHDHDVLHLLLKSVGPDRIVLGSDYPFPPGEDVPGALIESLPRASAAVKRRLLADNALEFLGMEAKKQRKQNRKVGKA